MIDNEIWLPVVGFERNYEVSNLGRVRSLPGYRDGKLVGRIGRLGYVKVCLSVDGEHTHRNTHTLVADAFLAKPNRPEALCVNHKDGDKANNKAENLEWVSYKENSVHAFKTGLSPKGQDHYETAFTDEDVMRIREEFRTESSVALAAKYSITTGAICALIQGKTWKHLPVLTYEGRKEKLYKPRSDFEKAARRVHGDKYDYSKVVYVRTLVPVVIGCPLHGLFEQKPNTHMQGSGCPKCATARRVALLSKH